MRAVCKQFPDQRDVHGRSRNDRRALALAGGIRVDEAAFRRRADGRRQPALSVIHQPRGHELRRAPHHRIRALTQEGHVARVEVMRPEMLAQPGSRHVPESRPGVAVDGLGIAPDRRVVVRHPTRQPIHVVGDLAAVHRQLADHAQQRFVAFAQVRHLGGPVIHFEVDVERVSSCPRRHDVRIPDALQIQRLPSFARTGDQQITPELVIQRRERLVAPFGVMLDPFRGWPRAFPPVRTEVQGNPVKKRAIIVDVLVP